MEFDNLSIRAKTYIGVKLFEKYCARENIEHEAIDEFCNHMKSLAVTTNIPDWDNNANSLSITGLGDDLPHDITELKRVNDITCFIREISATPIY